MSQVIPSLGKVNSICLSHQNDMIYVGSNSNRLMVHKSEGELFYELESSASCIFNINKMELLGREVYLIYNPRYILHPEIQST